MAPACSFVLYLVMLGLMAVEVQSVGDERTYISWGRDDDDRQVCVQAEFSGMISSAGITGEIVKIDSCSIAEDVGDYASAEIGDTFADFAGKIVLLKQVSSCSIFADVEMLASVTDAKALVVVNWWNEDEESSPLSRGFVSFEGPFAPTCTVSKRTGDALWNSNGQVTIISGRSETLKVSVQDARIKELVVDEASLWTAKPGEVEENSFTILDTYRRVVIVAEKSGSNPFIRASVTDGFKTGETWRCSSKAPDGNWRLETFDSARLAPPAIVENGINSTNDAIWLNLASKVYCFGTRSRSAVTKYGFKYEFFQRAASFYEAKSECQNGGGNLVSIHSAAEKNLVSSMVPWNSKDGGVMAVYIGFNDIGNDGAYSWTDGFLVDFTNWKPGNPQLGTMDCTVITETGWESVTCGTRQPFMCKTFVGFSTDDTNDLDEQKCFAYLGDYELRPNTPPQPLIGAKMCNFQSGYSCCGPQFINENIFPQFEDFQTSLESRECIQAMEDLVCMFCLPTSHRFFSFNPGTEGLTIAVCDDTCSTFYESCKNEKAFKESFATIRASDVCRFLDQAQGFSGADIDFVVKGGHQDNCLRIDDRPPYIAEHVPANGTELPKFGDGFKLVFDEGLQIKGGELQLWHTLKHGGKPAARIPLLNNPDVFLTTTMFLNDTLNVVLSKKTPCVPKGDYSIFIPSFSIVDMSGNAFQGTNSPRTHYVLSSTSNNHCGGRGMGLLIFLLLVVFGGLGFVGFRYVKKNRHASGGFFESIGDIASSISERMPSAGDLRASFATSSPRDSHDIEYQEMESGGEMEMDSRYEPPSSHELADQ